MNETLEGEKPLKLAYILGHRKNFFGGWVKVGKKFFFAFLGGKMMIKIKGEKKGGGRLSSSTPLPFFFCIWS